MGRMKENPRYNVISVRISDATLAELVKIKGERSTSELLQEALEDKISHEQQKHYDLHLRAAGV